MVGISPSYLSVVERDLAPPPSEHVIEDLEDSLEMTRGELLGVSERVSREVIKLLARRPVLRELVVAYSTYSDEEIAVVLGGI
jgi:transcriptional regulator with XRE-family HTH domain